MADLAVFHADICRHGHQRKGIGGPVTHLAIALPAAGGCGQRDGGDQLAILQHIVLVRPVARQAMKVADRHGTARPVLAFDLDRGIQRAHRHRHVAGIGGDALVRRAKDGVQTGCPADRLTARSGLAFVAGHGGVVEIIAAGALAQIAARGGLVAQLTARPGQNGARQHWIIAADAVIGGAIAVGHQRANAQATVFRLADLLQVQPVDVDQLVRRHHFQLHQIEQIGAARDEIMGGAAGLADRFERVRGAGVGERLHASAPSATSRIASTILG